MIRRARRLWRRTRGHWWFIRNFGPIGWAEYEQIRRERERELGEVFDPVKHGERMLRAIGATEDKIAEARRRGLA